MRPRLLIAVTLLGLAAAPKAMGATGPVDIGDGRELYLECAGQGRPTVLLEAGYRNRGDIWSVSGDEVAGTPVFRQVSRFTRVCEYDRPGTTLGTDGLSRSTPVPMPRTAGDAVADLHALVREAGLRGPFVLVGHSTGGLLIRLYQRTHPRQVAGLVLVDALTETLRPLLGADWPIYRRLALVDAPPAIAGYRDLELFDFDASFTEMEHAGGVRRLRGVDVAVLSHGRPFDLPPGFAPGFAKRLERLWRRTQDELAHLAPGGRDVRARRSSHYIQLDQPRLVSRTIRRVVRQVRAGAR